MARAIRAGPDAPGTRHVLVSPTAVCTHRRIFSGTTPSSRTSVILAFVLWVLGYPERAVQQCDQALTFAQGLSHPFSLAFALSA